MGSTLIVEFVSVITIFIFFSVISPTHGYDPLDPNGNITIKWDVLSRSDSSYTIQVTIKNMQQYRHIENPGWRLSWDWKNKEAIMNMWGAEATEQGNCSAFPAPLPHCCLRHPVIVDLLPGAPYKSQSANCCRGGVISSLNQDDSNYVSSFRMVVAGLAPDDSAIFPIPENFTLGVRGYSCGLPASTAPSKFKEGSGRRKTQALATWDVTCMYSQTLSSQIPKCCVSLSAFYNETIVPCQRCSCGCQSNPAIRCIKDVENATLLQPNHDPLKDIPTMVQCTKHMCPIRVHWHVKVNYKEYWRVKITVTNFNAMKNYSDWNLVVLHPNLKSVEQVFSFSYKPLHQYRYNNDSGMFWGLPHYNDVLLQVGETGNVQTELLLKKDKESFTFSEGWAFPRRILFNGDECVMPSPDNYPRTPNHAASPAINLITAFFSALLLLIFV